MAAAVGAIIVKWTTTSESGQDLVEYALLVGLVALVAVTAVSEVGKTLNTVFWAFIAASIP